MGYTTPERVKTELGIAQDFGSDTSPTLDEVNDIIEEESDYVDLLSGRIWKEQVHTDVYLDYDGSERILLKNSPIISVESLEYNPYSPGQSERPSSWESLTEEEQFTVYPDMGEIVLLLKHVSPKVGRKRFKISYTSGFSEVPKTVEMLTTKRVAYRILQTELKRSIYEKDFGGTIRVGSVQIIQPTDFGASGLTKLQEEVASLESKIIGGFGVYRYDI